MRKKRFDDIDDGRVIASMNVDGMPWYTQGDKTNGGFLSRNMQSGEPPSVLSPVQLPVKLTRRENRAFASGVIKAILLVTFVYIGALFLFILFCTNVWFR